MVLLLCLLKNRVIAPKSKKTVTLLHFGAENKDEKIQNKNEKRAARNPA